MIKVKLTPEEKKIMRAIEADEYIPVSGSFGLVRTAEIGDRL